MYENLYENIVLSPPHSSICHRSQQISLHSLLLGLTDWILNLEVLRKTFLLSSFRLLTKILCLAVLRTAIPISCGLEATSIPLHMDSLDSQTMDYASNPSCPSRCSNFFVCDQLKNIPCF